jgi:hypothetical protein
MTTKKTTEIAKSDSSVDSTFKKNVDSMIANRDYFKSQLESIMVESQDYHVIKEKKSLSKGGAEKLATGFKLYAKFKIDEEAKKAFADVPGLIAYRCELYNSKDEFQGEGGGADTLSRNQNDPNKTIKMAQKRAYVDAVIRTTGLSDIFTQDLEDMQGSGNVKSKQADTKKTINDPHKPASDKQKYLIKKLMEDLQLSMEWLEKKAGKLETMKMGVASQVIEQLKNKQNNLEPKVQEETSDGIPVIDSETGEVIKDAKTRVPETNYKGI